MFSSFLTSNRSSSSPMSSTSNPSFTNPKSCPHLSSHRQNHSLSFHKSPPNNPTCSSCPNPSISPLYLCLICSTISCSRHAPSHSLSSPGHDISLDVDRAELFCFSCNDQVYDADFDARRRRRWRRRGMRHPWGLRGLNNLGNTCFMNSVLQALLHTPPLRSYFLGDAHRREVCRQRKRTRGDGDGNCLACVVEGVFLDVFSGERKPYSPARFLYRLDVDDDVENCESGIDFGRFDNRSFRVLELIVRFFWFVFEKLDVIEGCLVYHMLFQRNEI